MYQEVYLNDDSCDVENFRADARWGRENLVFDGNHHFSPISQSPKRGVGSILLVDFYSLLLCKDMFGNDNQVHRWLGKEPNGRAPYWAWRRNNDQIVPKLSRQFFWETIVEGTWSICLANKGEVKNNDFFRKLSILNKLYIENS